MAKGKAESSVSLFYDFKHRHDIPDSGSRVGWHIRVLTDVIQDVYRLRRSNRLALITCF